MTLPLPDLDDRRWTDLVEEGRTLIPVHAPGWTDHNVHDPGITLIELLAWIAETDVYRLNRVPASHRRKFLALAGVTPAPPRGARAAVAFELDDTAPATLLPAGLEVEGDATDGTPVRFRTRRALTAVAGSLDAVQVRSGDVLQDLTERRRRGEPLALFGDDPRPGTALYLGLRLPAGPPADAVSFYFRVAGTDDDERRRLLEELRRGREACLPSGSLLRCDGAATSGTPSGDDEDAVLIHHSARVVWEAHVGRGHWRTLKPDAVRDATRAFTLSGPVELVLPADLVPVRLGAVEAELYYLRCRWLAGSFDAAPVADDVLVNGVVAEQEARIEAEALGKGFGRPNHLVKLSRPLVAGGDVEIATLEGGEAHAWSERTDFDASGRGDAHFVVDRPAGSVVFGDGERGRTVPDGATITAGYVSTSGAAGNLEAGSVRRLASTLHNEALVADFAALAARVTAVHQPKDAYGGSSGETLDEAASRAFELVEKTPRAVTLDDYEERAFETPGVRLARVAARANLHPAFPCFRAPGVVTVLVVPHLPASRPVPSPPLRHAVAAYLEPRRPLGTRLEVIGPTWVEVSVRATVRAFSGVGKSALAEELRAALDRFFHPLRGGPEGVGWPFGRDVYRSEVLQVLDETPGADHVLALELLDADGKASCGNLCVPPVGLVAAGSHEIEVV